jgi:predicted NAD/FAD-binding protein
VRAVRRIEGRVEVRDDEGAHVFDRAIVATHADAALAMLEAPTTDERRLLGAFGYADNEAVLHRDVRLMPRRRAAWASWNYLSRGAEGDRQLSVTYWMNRLQGIAAPGNLFVTLNPLVSPADGTVLARRCFRHPQFDARAGAAQEELWSLQGQGGVWFAGSYFGAGFHEDGLQAGLAAAEELGGVRRPWRLADESGRISLTPRPEHAPAAEQAA